MTDFLAIPPAAALAGTVRVPSSKSATNRAFVAAALTPDPVEIRSPLESDDTAALRRCLTAMGARFEPVAGGVRVAGPLAGGPRTVELDVADSGTAARFLAAVCAAVPGRWRLTGSARLRERPIGELVDALAAAGARVTYDAAPGFLPLTIEGEGGRLAGRAISVDASRSSQFLSALLLAGLAVEGGLEARASAGLVSAPYVATTVETLSALGHGVVAAGSGWRVARGRARPKFEVPGDYSSGVPLLGAVAAAGGRVRLEGLRRPSSDADAGAIPVLEAMGLQVASDGEGLEGQALVAGASGASLRPVQARAADFPDAVPTLAAVAALAEGESRFSGVGHLRLKESDRLAAIVEVLGVAGARARIEGDDVLVVEGPARGALQGAGVGVVARTRRDHRIAMAAAILSLRVPGLLVEDPACVAKSYPAFFRDLESLRSRQ